MAMELESRPDFEQVRERWGAFWRGENTRPMVNIVIPKEGVEPVPHPPYLVGHDGNFGALIDQLVGYVDSHQFLGDSVPYFVLEWGPDTFSAYLGADLEFQPSTSWCKPFVRDWDDVDIRFRRDSIWWQRTADLIHAVRARCDGKLLINPPTLVANYDALAAIRGIQGLLVDMIECPDKVKRAADAVCRAHDDALRAYAEELDWDTWGSVSVSGTYCPGRQSRPQCDMSCMISSDMFREFVLPCLHHEARLVDAMEYHLDGPGAVQHIEALAEIDRLDMICFVSGSGNETMDCTSIHRKIDDLGRGQSFGGTHEQIKRMWQEYKSKKLIFYTSASSRADAERFTDELDSLGGK